MTCSQCRQDILEADQIEQEEECVLRDHLLAGPPEDRAARDPERVAQALRHGTVVAGGVAAPLQLRPTAYAQPAQIPKPAHAGPAHAGTPAEKHDETLAHASGP